MDLEGHIRALVRDEVARLLGTTATPVYSTATRETWPPRCTSRRMARDRIRAVAGHEQVGSGRATQWQVAREAYESHHRRQPVLHVVATTSDEELANRALTAADLRSTRRSA